MAKLRFRSRWLQISLRGLFVAITLLCIVLGWYLWQVRRQQAMVRWIESLDGQAYYSYQQDRNPLQVRAITKKTDPPGPDWLRDFLGIDFMDRIVEVDLSQNNVFEISMLANLPHLEGLILSGEFSDIKPLENLTALRKLYLKDTKVRDISPLRNLTRLDTLDLSGTKVREIDALVSLADLWDLDLSHTQVSELAPLENLKGLALLNLSHTPVTDVKALSGLTNLVHLDLSFTKVESATPLATLSKMEYLQMERTSISVVPPIDRMPSLSYLYLSGTKVRDLTPLVRNKSLRYLWIDRLDIAESEIDRIRELLTNCSVYDY